MKKKKYWFKIDNAGKVFPAISNDNRTNTFRLSMTLVNEINKDVLEQAVQMILPRFEAFAVKIQNGIFWQFFSENHRAYRVEKESSIINKYVHPRNNKGYLFKVYYYDNRITLETFHALSDGFGSLSFLISIVYQYLILLGNKMDSEGMILGMKPIQPKENEDSFLVNYDKNMIKKMTEEDAFHFKGELFDYGFSHLFSLKLSLVELKKVAKEKYNSTITEFFASTLCYCIMKQNADFYKQKKPLKLFIPINLRPFFDSITLRNFSLYLKTVFNPEDHLLNFNDVIMSVKNQFIDQIDKNVLKSRISGYVSLEKAWWLRFLPAFIKNLAFKIGYDILGTKINTASFSNLGYVKLPKDMQKHIQDVNFVIGGFGIGIGSIGYQNNINLNFTSRIKDVSLFKSISDFFISEGISVNVISNYKEAYDELL